MLYFDHAASTTLNKVGLEVLKESLDNDFANPSAGHKLGKALAKRIESARKTFLTVFSDDSYNFIFTSSATESNNTIIRSIVGDTRGVILSSSGDHASINNPIHCLGNKIVEIPINDSGEVNYEALEKMSLSDVSLLAIAHVNNHTGNIQDVERIAHMVKAASPDAHIHIDGVQAFGKIDFSLKDSNIDSYTISGHKIGAMKGISGLYLKKGITLKPLLIGGGHENGLRSSTLFAPLIFGFEATVKDVFNNVANKYKNVEVFYEKVKTAIIANCKGAKFPFKNVSPYILTFIIPEISSDIIMRHLEQKDVIISSSSACSSKVKGFSSVYQALHIDEAEHKNVLRISFSAEQTNLDTDKFIDEFIKCINKLNMLIK